MNTPVHRTIALALVVLGGDVIARQLPPPVKLGAGGRLEYVTDARGDRIVDFSHAGYRGGGRPLPVAAARVVLHPGEGDDSARIQAALDFVATLAADAHGLRGAVLLAKGRYRISGQLRLRTSGVVLRGAGPDADGTVLIATGTERRALIEIGGRAADPTAGEPVAVTDNYAPVGTRTLRVARAEGLAAGTRVLIERPSPATWIAQLGMDDAPGRQPYEWKPGTLNVRWERTLTAVRDNTLTLDAPLTVSLDARFGGGTVRTMARAERVENAGVEYLRCESTWDRTNPADEEHAWTAVHIGAARDVWVADLAGVHFPGSLVYVGAGAVRVTVQDCRSLEPVSENGGYRRMTFHTAGQQTLFLRCRAEQGRNDFTTGYLAAGPNVFLDCVAHEPRSFSGSAGSWASGILFDNVRLDGATLRLDNLETWNQGVGWAAANSVIWQSTASVIICRSPPGAPNWAVGPWAQFVGDGRWAEVNEFVRPDSLYLAQLIDRLGATAAAALERRRYDLAAAIRVPQIEDAVGDLAAKLAPRPAVPGAPLAVARGWLVAGDRLLVGEQVETPTWQGRLLPARSPERGFALTRFVPDQTGPGLTDDLNEVADAMITTGQVAVRHHWGLWYDRRRDDHEMIRRPDGDVWPPFFEQPWARSGRGTASNGLSRYDLTRFNPWYFGRLREFAGIARAKGLLLINEMYFQHNILEAGAHWAEFPWRSANNIQETGFPEPPPYVESDGSAPRRPEYGKRIFMAGQFYDVSHPVRRELHRTYIRQCLSNLAEETNVMHTLGGEYSGPLHFMQFWLDVVAEWRRETGRDSLIALSAPKDVQDAILADPVRSGLVDVIDLKYWWRTERELYAPKGGQDLAPRQHERLWKGGRPNAASIARIVREYRTAYPEKAVITGLREADGWAFAAAGGSLPKLPVTTEPTLLAALPWMRPMEPGASAAGTTWVLGVPGRQYFGYTAGGPLTFDLPNVRGRFVVQRIDLATGKIIRREPVTVDQRIVVDAAATESVAVWITRAE